MAPIKMMQLLLEPPVAIWILAMVFLVVQLTHPVYIPANPDFIVYRTK
jgi:hypothetical protein